jgi:hypothetical protein
MGPKRAARRRRTIAPGFARTQRFGPKLALDPSRPVAFAVSDDDQLLDAWLAHLRVEKGLSGALRRGLRDRPRALRRLRAAGPPAHLLRHRGRRRGELDDRPLQGGPRGARPGPQALGAAGVLQVPRGRAAGEERPDEAGERPAPPAQAAPRADLPGDRGPARRAGDQHPPRGARPRDDPGALRLGAAGLRAGQPQGHRRRPRPGRARRPSARARSVASCPSARSPARP